jgi:hypothetical protein
VFVDERRHHLSGDLVTVLDGRTLHERTKLACSGAKQPLVEVTHTPPRDETAESLQQLISTGETFIVVEDVFDCVAFVWFALLGRTQAQPAQVDGLDAWPAASTATARSGWWTRTPPGRE